MRRIGIICPLLVLITMIVPLLQVRADVCPQGGEHEYKVELIKQALPEEDGLRVYTCIKCGYSYEEILPATAHTWGEWFLLHEPLCEMTGVEQRTCRHCGYFEQRELAALGHNFHMVSAREPDCEEGGSTRYECSRCGEFYETLSPALGHQWGEWQQEGNREIRFCQRDPSHQEERNIETEPTTELPTTTAETTPEETVSQESTTERETTTPETTTLAPESTLPKETTPSVPEKEPVWTVQNTVAAAAGTLVVGVFGFFIFTLYITPLLWIRRKKKEKEKELMKRIRS